MLFLALLSSPARSIAQDDFLLARRRAGSVQVGMTVDALHRKHKPQSTKLVARYPEGMFTPMLEVYLEGAAAEGRPSLLIEIDKENEWIVRSIRVTDRRFRTAKGIGVGATLGEIRKAYAITWIAFGEGALYANVEEVGLSFELEGANPPREWYKTGDQRLIPDGAKVVSALVYWDPEAKRSNRDGRFKKNLH
jgi:hypothetical protein